MTRLTTSQPSQGSGVDTIVSRASYCRCPEWLRTMETRIRQEFRLYTDSPQDALMSGPSTPQDHVIKRPSATQVDKLITLSGQFVFSSALASNIHSISPPRWECQVDVYTDDLESILVDGLEWHEADIQVSAGDISIEPEYLPQSRTGWSYGRVYYLEEAGNPRWAAKITVRAPKTSTLSELSLRDVLLANNIYGAWAWDLDRNKIYDWQKHGLELGARILLAGD
ncbi:hypothetical protein XA68_16387 [Ophiocordyceps unilateralis]|uniref:Uncharacterized protein n=1 Tax=Ophiocordyceps unilateralis TaxID=268505 RepID=A0A2A9P6G0_OPHUN|nr:hypothetical protein XA68_16387 [Ophiocordyceps unilateralis]